MRRNNIFYTTAAGSTLSMVDASGDLDLYNNWAKPGWVKAFGPTSGSVTVYGAFVEGSSPGFVSEAEQVPGCRPLRKPSIAVRCFIL